jgi:hypothetical protein
MMAMTAGRTDMNGAFGDVAADRDRGTEPGRKLLIWSVEKRNEDEILTAWTTGQDNSNTGQRGDLISHVDGEQKKRRKQQRVAVRSIAASLRIRLKSNKRRGTKPKNPTAATTMTMTVMIMMIIIIIIEQ